jgi:hypothetical protein
MGVAVPAGKPVGVAAGVGVGDTPVFPQIHPAVNIVIAISTQAAADINTFLEFTITLSW